MKKSAMTAVFTLLVTGNALAQNIIVDTKGVDQEKYSADMYQCQQLSEQVQEQNVEGTGRTTIKHMGRAAALGAGAAAIGGGSGTEGAGIGAGIGLVTGVLGSSAGHHEAQANYQNEKEMVVRNCMKERGYTILN